MLNRIIIMGRLTRDPELRHTPSGVPVARFSLAVDRDFKNKETGERGVDFIDVAVWRNSSDFVMKYFTKGRLAVVEGRLQLRDWTDKDGNKRRSAEVVADNVYFGESRRDADSGGSAYGGGGSYGGGATYGSGSGYGGSGGGSYNRPASSAPPAPDYGLPPSGGDQFAELNDDEDELPF